MTRRLAIALALTIVVSALVVSAAGKPPSGSALSAGTGVLPNPVADLGDVECGMRMSDRHAREIDDVTDSQLVCTNSIFHISNF